jgi:hypothetical protein
VRNTAAIAKAFLAKLGFHAPKPTEITANTKSIMLLLKLNGGMAVDRRFFGGLHSVIHNSCKIARAYEPNTFGSFRYFKARRSVPDMSGWKLAIMFVS